MVFTLLEMGLRARFACPHGHLSIQDHSRHGNGRFPPRTHRLIANPIVRGWLVHGVAASP